jgi:hypothetical protein
MQHRGPTEDQIEVSQRWHCAAVPYLRLHFQSCLFHCPHKEITALTKRACGSLSWLSDKHNLVDSIQTAFEYMTRYVNSEVAENVEHHLFMHVER